MPDSIATALRKSSEFAASRRKFRARTVVQAARLHRIRLTMGVQASRLHYGASAKPRAAWQTWTFVKVVRRARILAGKISIDFIRSRRISDV
jgi:hypothetical protein